MFDSGVWYYEITPDNRVVYQKEKKEAECLIDFIYDDMAEHDAGITEYDEAEYEDKCGRDSLREMLRSESLPIGRAVICLYDSEKDPSETILEGYIAQDYIQFGGYLYEGGIKGNPVAVYDYADKERRLLMRYRITVILMTGRLRLSLTMTGTPAKGN